MAAVESTNSTIGEGPPASPTTLLKSSWGNYCTSSAPKVYQNRRNDALSTASSSPLIGVAMVVSETAWTPFGSALVKGETEAFERHTVIGGLTMAISQ